jgi:type III secretion protein U
VSDDKTEKPTDKKLEDAREKGQIPVSRDLARLCSLVVVAEVAFMMQPLWRGAIESILNLSIMRIGQPFQAAVMEVFTSAGLLLIMVFAIFFVLCTVAGVAGFWGQFGILVSPEVLTPNFDKLNPVNGIKQLFSMKKLMELLLTMGKGAVIGWIIYIGVRDQLPQIISLSGGEPKDILFGFIEVVRSIFHVVVVLCLCIALIDYGVQHHFHIKQLMMDMEEIKKEYKESEGDPMIKQKRKQLAHEWANSAPVAKTQDANALVVNPTHFAVAMLYDPKEGAVPIVLAKGKDELAHAMIQRAKECGIPVIRHVWLARTLYATCRPDTFVPKSSYEAVAYVYAVVNELVAMNETHREVELESRGEPPEAYRE